MSRFTKAEFEARRADSISDIAENASTLKRKQTAIVRKAYNWQDKIGTYCWDAPELVAETGITLDPGGFLLEYEGVQVQFFREPTPDDEPDMPENEGIFGHYCLKDVGDGFYRLDKVAKAKASPLPPMEPEDA